MKKALLFGINDYPGSQNDLQGCVNDVYLIADKLAKLGFDINISLDQEVTIQKFKNELTDLIICAEKGDYLAVSYSGHGTQLPDRSGDEHDGYDEALYLYDGVLIDDNLQDILKKKQEGVHLFMIMDSCFSGSNTRFVNKKPRFVQLNANQPVMHKRKRAIMRSPDMDYVVLTGCAENQTSADAYMNGKYHGAMTYYAMKTLQSGDSCLQWYRKIRKYLPSVHFDQIPQLEGKVDMMRQGVFGTELRKKCFLKFW